MSFALLRISKSSQFKVKVRGCGRVVHWPADRECWSLSQLVSRWNGRTQQVSLKPQNRLVDCTLSHSADWLVDSENRWIEGLLEVDDWKQPLCSLIYSLPVKIILEWLSLQAVLRIYRQKFFGEQFNFTIVHVLQKMNINPQRLYPMSICRQCPPAVPTVEGSCVSQEKTSTELSAKRHNRRIRIHGVCLQVLQMTPRNPSGYCQLKPS